MSSLMKKIFQKSSKANKREQMKGTSTIVVRKIDIEHLHFVDFEQEWLLKQKSLEKNQMQTKLRMEEIRRELSQLHSQSQDFLKNVKKLDKDIENEQFRRKQMHSSTNQIFFFF